jgi:membrane dipeptidase
MTTASSSTSDAWWLDGHLDLAYLAVAGRDFGRPADPASGCVSYPDLREAPVRIALATLFTEAKAPGQPGGYIDSSDVEGAHAAGAQQLAWYHAEEAAGRMRIIRTVADLNEVAARDSRATDAPLAIVLLMECADPIRTPNEAQWWFDRGVRVVGMSWGYGSRYSGGNSTGGPLTSQGRELIAAFDALGILHDASHLSDASLDGLLAATSRRVVATHSNCRALLEPKERHLTDDQIHAIAARDGVIGLNLYGAFLSVGRTPTLDDCIAQVERVASLVGRDRTCLGSDLDGGFGPSGLPTGLRHPRDYARLDEALAARGWSPSERAGFRHGQWLRVLRDSLPAGQ